LGYSHLAAEHQIRGGQYPRPSSWLEATRIHRGEDDVVILL
jgi:hypothetical protein